MAEHALKNEYPLTDEIYDYENIITEDDEPVDNLFSEKQRRLLTESLNISWNPGKPFIAVSDVGLFYSPQLPPLVPDMLLGLDVQMARDLWKKKNRAYFVQVFGKPPELVVEIVSNKKGDETGGKIRKYAQAGVKYYIIMDPQCLIQRDVLRIYELSGGQYIPMIGRWLPHVGIGVTLWEGKFDGQHQLWLRWTDRDGNLILTGHESNEKERRRAEAAEMSAETERRRADAAEMSAETERRRAEALAEKLRQLGVDPG